MLLVAQVVLEEGDLLAQLLVLVLQCFELARGLLLSWDCGSHGLRASLGYD